MRTLDAIDEISKQVAKLNKEALDIVRPTPHELKAVADMYADDYGPDAADLLMEDGVAVAGAVLANRGEEAT